MLWKTMFCFKNFKTTFFLQDAYLHAPLSFHLAAHPLPEIPKI